MPDDLRPATHGWCPANRADELLFLCATGGRASYRPADVLVYPNVPRSDGTLLDMRLPADQGGYPVVRVGSTSGTVEVVQVPLGRAITGTFDAATWQAVIDFQKTHTDPVGNPLVADWVVGWNTWLALVRAA